MWLSTRTLVHFAIILFSLPLIVSADDKSCTAREGGKLYDLSKLKSKKDYVFEDAKGHNYTINVCKSLVTETWNVKGKKPDDAAAVTRRGHGDFSLGAKSDKLIVRGGNPVLIYKDGSPCPKSKDAYASTAIRFVCNRDIFSAGQPELIAALPDDDEDEACAFMIEWKTHYACPAGISGGLIGGIFYIIIFVLFSIFLLYLIVGIVYRHFVLGKHGTEVLPRLTPSGFGSTFRFVKDAIDDLWSRRSDPFDRYGSAWPGWNIGRRGGRDNEYDYVPSTREEGEAMLNDDQDRESTDGHDPWRGAPSSGTAGPPDGMDRSGVIRL